jgi:hypothetical protein
MDILVDEKPMADLRDYLAEERAFLAWIRATRTPNPINAPPAFQQRPVWH